MFFSWEKHIISHFLGFFEGSSKWLIMCFSRPKNIKSLTFKISGTLIVIIPSQINDKRIVLSLPWPNIFFGEFILIELFQTPVQ
jgi:hypothetical protein